LFRENLLAVQVGAQCCAEKQHVDLHEACSTYVTRAGTKYHVHVCRRTDR
jgi:hypothetical protein